MPQECKKAKRSIVLSKILNLAIKDNWQHEVDKSLIADIKPT